MSREGKLAKNTLILSIGTFLPKLAAFVTLPVLTGCLTKEEMGTYDLVTVLVSFILPVATLQIQTAAFRFLIDCREDEYRTKSIITNIVAFIIPPSVLALVILYILLPGSYINRILICGYYLADILVNAVRQVARGINKSLDYSISAIISAIGKLVFTTIFVLWMKIGLDGAVIALFLASFISLVILAIKTRLFHYIDLSLINKKSIKELIQYSWPMVPNSMSMTIMRVSDRFVVTLFMGLSANAVYAIANKIPSLLTLAQTTFTMAWQENASIVAKDEDADEYYSSMFRTMYDLMAGFLGLLICVTPLLFRFFIRGDYSEAYYQMPILLLAMFFYSQCAYLGGIYVAFKDTKSVGITTIASAACNLIVDVLLIRYIGLYAASGSTLISYLLLFIFRLVDVQKLVKIKCDLGHTFFVIGLLILELMICYMQKPVWNVFNVCFGIIIFLALNKHFVKFAWGRFKSAIRR